MKSLDHFVYDGVDSRHFGIYLFDKDTYGGYAREYESIDIPGKSGSVLIDGKRYANKGHSYSCIIIDDAEKNMNALRAFLFSRQGYCRLEDTIHPEEFYQAVYRDEFTPVFSQDKKMVKFELNFERKPQRWLKVGDQQPIVLHGADLSGDGVTIRNPTLFPAYPLIITTGGKVLYVGTTKVTVHATAGAMTYIDCDLMEAYYADSEGNPTESRNYDVEFSTYDFPNLLPGDNLIKYEGSYSESVTIRPRWYTL